MKQLPLLTLLPILLIPAFSQTDGVDLVSDKPGRMEAKVAGLVLRADEATLNRETGELKMRGHVHITLPAREDHTLVRYGAGVVLTVHPIGLTADRVAVKDAYLKRPEILWWCRSTRNCPRYSCGATRCTCISRSATPLCAGTSAGPALRSRSLIQAGKS